MNPSVIRNIIPKDIPELLPLMEAFAAFNGSSDEFNMNERRLSEAFFKSSPDLYCIIAEVNEQVVGFLNYTFSFSSFELRYCLWVEDVFIHKAHRRKGLGEALFANAQKIAIDKDCSRVEWLVKRSNESGIRFYKNLEAKVDPGTIHVKWPLSS